MCLAAAAAGVTSGRPVEQGLTYTNMCVYHTDMCSSYPSDAGAGAADALPGVRRQLVELRAVAERLGAEPLVSRAPSELCEEMVHLRQTCNLLELEFSRVAAAFAATDAVRTRNASVQPEHT
jgi:hypothetical protein